MNRLPLAALAFASLVSVASAAQDTLAPPQGVVVQGVPPIATALAERLKPFGEFIPHSLVSWHPKRREMLVQRRGDAATQLHVVTEPGVRPVRLAELPAAIVSEWNRAGEPSSAVRKAVARLDAQGHVEIAVSTDGRRLASIQVVDSLESHVWVTDVASGQRRRITRPVKGDKVAYRWPRFAPDGRAVFATSDRGSEWRRLVRIALPGGAERVLTEHLKHDVDEFEVSAAAQRIAFTTNEGGSHSLRFIDLASLQEQPRPPLFSGVISGLGWRPGSAEVAFQLSSARAAGDVFSYDVAANKLARWTNGNSPRVNVSQFVEPRAVRWPLAEGLEVRAFHYHPPERFTGKRPVIVDFRGGPADGTRAGFLGERNYLVNELGIALLMPNVRGAPGTGKAFRRLGVGPRRDETARDAGAMLDWIRAQPDLDAERVLLLGTGAGGTIALAAATELPTRVAGVAAILPEAIPAALSQLARPALVVTGNRHPARLPSPRAPGTWGIEVENDGATISRREDARFVSAALVELAQKVLLPGAT